MTEITNNEIERSSASPLNQIKSELAEGQTIKDPQGSAQTAFQKFAAGAQFATPSGLEKAQPRKKKRGRPRKHPKKLSSHAEPLAALSGDVKTPPVDAALAERHIEEKKPAELYQYTAPFLGMLSQIPAHQLKNKAWALTKDESIEIAKALDPVINEFLPDMEKMDPKTAAILGFAIVTASIYHKKALEIEAASAAISQQQPVAAAVA